jgi:hypothetical protein
MTFDGQQIGDSVVVGGSPSRVVIEIPENATSGPHVIELVEVEGRRIIMARSLFDVEDMASGTSSWLPIAAALLATGVALSAWAMWRRPAGARIRPRWR